MTGVRIATGLVVLLVCLCGRVQSAESVSIVEASGRTTSDATLLEWTADQIVVRGEATIATSIDDLLEVAFRHEPLPLAGGDPLVILANGDRLVVRTTGIADDVLTATWHKIPSRPPLKLPLELVGAIVFDLPAASDDRQRLYANLQTLPAGDDIVLRANGDRVQGEFERMDATFVSLKTPVGAVKLDRARIHAIRMNPALTNANRAKDRRLMLTLRDGTRLTLSRVQLSDRDLKGASFDKLDFAIPVAECLSCRVFGVGAVPLSDREPTEYVFTPYLSTQWPVVKNANVLRGPLSIRGAEFGTGLGMHSRSRVSYAIQGNDGEFRATVGIDDCARGAGNVRFAVEVDDRPVWQSEEITGRSDPVVIPPINLNGSRTLTLITDFGSNADVADYADWCDAIVVMKRK
jgi:hypothetical protein